MHINRSSTRLNNGAGAGAGAREVGGIDVGASEAAAGATEGVEGPGGRGGAPLAKKSSAPIESVVLLMAVAVVVAGTGTVGDLRLIGVGVEGAEKDFAEAEDRGRAHAVLSKVASERWLQDEEEDEVEDNIDAVVGASVDDVGVTKSMGKHMAAYSSFARTKSL